MKSTLWIGESRFFQICHLYFSVSETLFVMLFCPFMWCKKHSFHPNGHLGQTTKQHSSYYENTSVIILTLKCLLLSKRLFESKTSMTDEFN